MLILFFPQNLLALLPWLCTTHCWFVLSVFPDIDFLQEYDVHDQLHQHIVVVLGWGVPHMKIGLKLFLIPISSIFSFLSEAPLGRVPITPSRRKILPFMPSHHNFQSIRPSRPIYHLNQAITPSFILAIKPSLSIFFKIMQSHPNFSDRVITPPSIQSRCHTQKRPITGPIMGSWMRTHTSKRTSSTHLLSITNIITY